MRDNPHTMNELNSQKFLAEVESLVSDDVRQYCDVEGAVEWAMRNDWSVEDCVKYLEA